MKNSLMRTMIAVAALSVAAGTVSAQTLNVQIPMSFRVGEATMAAGDYQIRISGGNHGNYLVYVRNAATRVSTVTLPVGMGDAPKAWLKDGSPKMSFACAGEHCTLTALWNGEGASALHFRSSEHPSVEARGLTVVTLALVKAR
jgi:hypothetical protein